MIGKLVSGGQTGVDRAALDVALASGIPCGGWCPKGRRAEDGIIPARYPLTETPSSDYGQRTAWNVRDSDGTLILTRGEPTGGTLLTLDECRKADKPSLVIDLAGEGDLAQAVRAAREWVEANLAGGVLNVAGPRSSEHPTVYDRARALLRALLGETD
jgi:Circularly permutated YpsA SLOG family